MKKKAFSILLSVVIAFGLWLYVITVINPEWEQTYADIPVTFQNENLLADRGLMIVSDEEPTVSLRLSGNRTDLMELNRSNISVICNVSSIEASGEFSLGYTVYYANNAITVAGKSPESIQLKVEKKITKPVDVVVDYKDTETPAGYVADKGNLNLSHTTIEISGPQSVVDRIQTAKIEIDLTGRTQTISGQFPYTLVDTEGEAVDLQQVEASAEQVELALKILKLKELPICVNVIYGGGATQTTAKVIWNPVLIKVAGTEAALADLEYLDVGTVDLSKLLENKELTFDIKLPAGINNVTGTDKVTVSITFLDLVTKELTISNFRPVNVPENADAVISNQEMKVIFRGPKAILDKLTAADVVMEVDFANVQPGSEDQLMAVAVIDKYPELGAVGSYSVVAMLRPRGS